MVSLRKRALIAALVVVLVPVYFIVFRQEPTTAPQNPQKHNVVMIVSDALRQDVLGCYGGEARTPNLDWLAKNGVVFDNAYANSPWTAPASVSMFTGNYATSYGYAPLHNTLKIHVPESEVLLAEVLSELGYAAKMKIENAHAHMHNHLQGFESLPSPDDYVVEATKRIGGEMDAIVGSDIPATGAYQTAWVVIGSLLETPPDKNFFLLHWIVDPHEPYDPIDRFKSGGAFHAAQLPRDAAFYSRPIRGRSGLTNREHEYLKALYIAEVESVDERVGFVIEALRRTNRLEDTYILFTSDHGEQFGEHGEHGHGALGRACNYYESLMRIPLILFGPGLPRGRRVQHPVSHVDLMPTLKDLLGVVYRDNAQGRSFKTHMFDDSPKRAPVYFTDVRGHTHIDALLEDNLKLISREDGGFELYDLSTDPGEAINISSSRPDRRDSMFQKILAIREMNKERKSMNVTVVGDSTIQVTDEEMRKTMENLRSLGYLK